MNWVTILGLVAAVCTTASFVPQAVKIIKTKRTADISLLTYLLLAGGIFMWFVYGLLLKDLPIIVANGTTFVFASTVLVLKLKYAKYEKREL